MRVEILGQSVRFFPENEETSEALLSTIKTVVALARIGGIPGVPTGSFELNLEQHSGYIEMSGQFHGSQGSVIEAIRRCLSS
jgi:hypothetical protein